MIVSSIYNLKRLKLSKIWLTIRVSVNWTKVNSFCHLLAFNEYSKFPTDGDKNVDISFQNLDQELHKTTSNTKSKIQKLYLQKQTQTSHLKRERILTASFIQIHYVLVHHLESSDKQIRCARNFLGETPVKDTGKGSRRR